MNMHEERGQGFEITESSREQWKAEHRQKRGLGLVGSIGVGFD